MNKLGTHALIVRTNQHDSYCTITQSDPYQTIFQPSEKVRRSSLKAGGCGEGSLRKIKMH